MADAGNDSKLSRRGFLRLGVGAGVAGMVAQNINLTAQSAHAANLSLSDAQMLDLVQKQTLRYFTDFAHPASGMARERSNNMEAYGKDLVVTGATGFGIMALVAGESRGFVTREKAVEQLDKITRFLEKADHYHGIFSHYMVADTGKTHALGAHDDGADLVETSYLMMGLLTARQHFSGQNLAEEALRKRITKLWERADWKFHEHENPKTHAKELMWHWSPKAQWDLSIPITGWNEALITHVLAASSPTHPVSADAYRQSWLTGNDFANGKRYGDITLPVGPADSGPLFFAHYSFLGLSPEGLKGDNVDYWQQNQSQTLINRAHCMRNPHRYKGYGPNCWGLTASDDPSGYAVHSPAADSGVISPTAALSSFPYTPEYSAAAMHHFFDAYKDKIWGEYGFTDAFSPQKDWYAKTYIGIDQGPIVAMIENYRSGLLWERFMSAPEVQGGLKKLGFESPYLGKQPPALIHMQQYATDARDFLDKLCGQKGYKPLNDSEFAAAIGLPADARWQVKQLRAAKEHMTQEQKRAILHACGYVDSGQIQQACELLSRAPKVQKSLNNP